MSWVGVVTDAGKTLFATYATSGYTLSIDTVESGKSAVADGASRLATMRSKTALISPNSPATYGIVESKVAITDGIQFRMRIGGAPAAVGAYTMKEIGLFVNATSGGTTTSTMVAYFNDLTGVDVPLASSFPDFAFTLVATLAIDNTTSISLTVDTSSAASRGYVDTELAKKVNIAQGSGNAGKFLIVGNDGNVAASDSAVYTGATSSADGKAGLVKKPSAGDQNKYLKGDGTWGTPDGATYYAGTGLSIAGTTFSLAASGATSGNYGPPQDVTGDNGAELSVPYITIDSLGRITAISNKTFTAVGTTYTAGNGIAISENTISLAATGLAQGNYGMAQNTTGSNNQKINIPYITVDANGKITSIANKEYTSVNSTYSAATSTTAGLVSADAQTFGGNKTFTGSITSQSTITGTKVYNAVWNDYAECRQVEILDAGYCVTESRDGVMKKTYDRLMPGCKITSDTYGTCMGETDEARTPIAVAGRVLVYPYRNISEYNLGDAVCSAPDGKIDIMTREEIREYPERIVGTVSEIPSYDIWYGGTKENPQPIPVNGRIWVYVR